MRHNITGSGSSIAAVVGDEIVVRVDELGSAGYQWQLPDPLPDGLEQIDVDQPPTDLSVGGARQVRLIGFRVTAPGRHVVSLRQFRGWEGTSQAIATFDVVVIS